MISYILNLLGINAAAGSIEYYLVLVACLDIITACAVCLIRYLMAPIDLLSKYKERNR